MRPEYDLRGGARGKYYERYQEEQRMGQTVNFDEVPDSQLLEPGMYEMEVDDLVDTASKAGNRMFKATFRVSGGTGEGTLIFDYFTVGNPDDPTATKQESWNNSPGARRLKQLFKALMIPLAGEIGSMIEAAKGQQFVAKVDQKVDSGTNPQFAGSRKNNISAFYPLGSRATGASTAPKATQATSPSAATLQCPFCHTSVARSAYQAHVQSAHPDEA